MALTGRLRETVFLTAMLTHSAVCKTGRRRKITNNHILPQLGIVYGWLVCP